MKINKIAIEPEIALKIFNKHNVLQVEVQEMFDDAPMYRKASVGQYIAVGLSTSRYITAYFRYDEKAKEAIVTTAYPSDDNQIKSYKKRIK